MKKAINLIVFCLLAGSLFSQDIPEKEIKTKVSEATVFLDGAQVLRTKNITLEKGKKVLKFSKLSPFIDAKSVQVKAQGQLAVLAVNHQQNYLGKTQKSEEFIALEKQEEQISLKIQKEQAYLAVIAEELAFLRENRDLGGKNQQVSITSLEQASVFYKKKLTALKMNEIEHNEILKKLRQQASDLQQQKQALSNKKEYPTGEVLVKIDVKKAGRFSFELSYLVKNVSWFPSYDIRAKNINSPVQLIYKANVKQNSKVNWNNIKLKFSSATPSASGVAPHLKPYYLDYYLLPPTYSSIGNNISGKVMESNGSYLPGVSVMVKGTTIGTTTDMGGNYSITVPNSSSQLEYSFIGFNTKTLPVRGEVMNVVLEENNQDLEEVVVVGYGTPRKERLASTFRSKAAGISADKSNMKIRGASSLAIPTAQVQKQTTVNFEIETPYSIQSGNKSYAVDVSHYNLPATFQYYCVPKINEDAFLIANIVNWEKYNLLEGEANLFFEDTYVGKTLMNTKSAKDTLEISLGRDKNISISREKSKNFTEKKFLRNKKEELRAWKTTIKNNKQQAINIIVLDQIPVSTNEEIEVDKKNISGGAFNTETGEVKWQFSLQPEAKKELDLRYLVTYPKNKRLIVE